MGNPSAFKSSLQNLQPDEFEAFVASVWSSMGWSTEVTRSSRDEGIDIVATKSEVYTQKAVIQAKCYSDENKVGRPDIQQYSTLKEQVPDADTVIVVTSGSFTSDAKDLAEQLNVKIVNGVELSQSALNYLPEEQLDPIRDRELKDDQREPVQSSQHSADSIPTDDLSQSEQDLADIYRGYYKRYIDDAKNQADKDRRLIFQLDGGERFNQCNYLLRDRTHYLRLSPEPIELLKKLALTVKKYGWEVLNIEVEPVERAGFNINRIKNDSAFSMVIDTGTTADVADPERQAKITSLLFSSVFGQDLSGVGIKEATGIYTRSSLTAEIK